MLLLLATRCSQCVGFLLQTQKSKFYWGFPEASGNPPLYAPGQSTAQQTQRQVDTVTAGTEDTTDAVDTTDTVITADSVDITI